MTAHLTITFSPQIVKALRGGKSINISLDTAASGAKSGPKAGANGQFRAGSLPARLVGWAGKRRGTFGIDDVMKALKIKRSHASMVITAARRRGAVRRVGRGAYAAK